MDPTLQVIGVVSVDYSALAKDVEELIEEFGAAGFTQLQQMKLVWRNRGFAFIFESRPLKLEPPQFMQMLFSTASAHLSPLEPLSWRLGALYTLYILYETQDFTPKVKIYLSVEQLNSLLSLVKEMKHEDEPLNVVQRLLNEGAFLYGHTAVTQQTVDEAAERRKRQIEIRLRLARKKLLSEDVHAEEHVGGSLASGLDSDADLIREYNRARESIFERVNCQEQQQNKITIDQEVLQAARDQEEFRADYIARRPLLLEDIRMSEDPESPSLNLEDLDFINELEEEMGALVEFH